jgi:hypothetical protein
VERKNGKVDSSMHRTELSDALRNIKYPEYYPDGALRQCVFTERTPLELPCGTLIPQYLSDPQRKRLTRSVEFFPDGALKTVVLQEVTDVETSVGVIPAEFVTFSESGTLRRILTSYGVITGFWTEQHEYEFIDAATYRLPFGTFEGKTINLTFYESGAFESFTIWAYERFELDTPVGRIPIRIGAGCYEDGTLESTEPLWPLEIETPIGTIEAYDPDAEGIDGGWNSLNFTQDGKLRSLLSIGSQVTVLQNGTVVETIGPQSVLSHYQDAQTLEPFKVSFENGSVRFGGREDSPDDAVYSRADYDFLVEPFDTTGFQLGCIGC